MHSSALSQAERYQAHTGRYDNMSYRRCGNSGLKLAPISLGFWQHAQDHSLVQTLCCYAFDHGITHFDLANNYGPPPGIAETHVGRVLQHELKCHRDELIISTKAGYDMWPGPYGNFGSRKYLMASVDQSLQRLGLDYVDIFYHHRPDQDTPLEETIGALADIVAQGKAIYAGISNYFGADIAKVSAIAQAYHCPLIINQVKYSMLTRRVESEALSEAQKAGHGIIAFSPLEQGLLSNRYLNGIPNDSRAAKGINNLEKRLTPELLSKLQALNQIAEARGQSLAQLAIQWVLRHVTVCSVIMGASRVEQLADNLDILKAPIISNEELSEINSIL